MLIVEDDNLSVGVMKRIFRADFEMFICDSAEEFYKKYGNNSFDMIIMDISLRGTKSGLDLIKEIKEMPLHNGTPIVCLTAHVQSHIRQEATESGSDLFIIKPVSNKVLKEAVESLLKSI